MSDQNTKPSPAEVITGGLPTAPAFELLEEMQKEKAAEKNNQEK